MAGTAMENMAIAASTSSTSTDSISSSSLCASALLQASRGPSLRGLMKHHFGKEPCDDSARTESTRSSSTIGSSLHSRLNTSEHNSDGGEADVGSVHGIVLKGPGCVRFNNCPGTVVCEVPNLADIGSEQRWNTWWCSQEYQAMRLAAKYATKQIKKNAPNAAQTIQQVFTSSIAQTESKNSLSATAFATLVQDPMAASPAAARVINQLDAQWSGSSSLPCRGLEKYVTATAIKTLRTNSMAQARKTAVQLYEQQRGMVSDDDIAQAYMEQSRYALLFARCLGVADEKAAERVYSEQPSPGSPNDSKRRSRSGRLAPARSSSSDEMSVCSMDSVDSSGMDSLCMISPPGANLRNKIAAYNASSVLPSKTAAAAASMPDCLDQTVSPSITGGNGRQRSLEKTFSKRGLARLAEEQAEATKEDASRSLKRSDSTKKQLLGTFRRTDSKRALAVDSSSSEATSSKPRPSSRRLSVEGDAVTSTTRKARRSGRRSSTSDVDDMKAHMDAALKRTGSSRRLSEDGSSVKRQGSSRGLSGGSEDGAAAAPSVKRQGSSRRLSETEGSVTTSVKRQGSSRRLSETEGTEASVKLSTATTVSNRRKGRRSSTSDVGSMKGAMNLVLKRTGSSRRLSEAPEGTVKRQGSSRKLNDYGEIASSSQRRPTLGARQNSMPVVGNDSDKNQVRGLFVDEV